VKVKHNKTQTRPGAVEEKLIRIEKDLKREIEYQNDRFNTRVLGGEGEVESVVKQSEFKIRANSKTNDSFTHNDRREKEVRS
jgi:hypothetical protein